MNTYNIEKSLCEALNLPDEYSISDQELRAWQQECKINAERVFYEGRDILAPFYGKKHTEETKQKISIKSKRPRPGGKKSDLWKAKRSANTKGKRTEVLCKPVLYNGVVYPSIKNAAEQNNVHRRVIRKNATLIHE